MTKIKRSEWPLNILVGTGWLAAIAAIGVLLTRNAAPFDDAAGKVAIMAGVILGLCWLSGRPSQSNTATGDHHARCDA